MAFLEKTVAVGIADTELYACPATLSGSAHGLTFSNITSVGRTITLKLYSQLTGLTTQVTSSGQAIPANSQFTWPKPINMVAGDRIIASADVVSAVVGVIAVYLDQGAQPSSAFVPRGTWSATANYSVNDVVVAADGVSYLAVSSSLNSAPPSATWMILASKGNAGTNGTNGTNGLGLTAQAVGFIATAGTTTKTLTVDDDLTTAQAARRNAANTFTDKQTLNGNATATGLGLVNATEKVTVAALGAATTVQVDVNTQAILYYTAAATANWTLNVRHSSTVALNTVMAIGESLSVVFMNTNGATAFYATGFTVDGVAVAPKWQGAAPAAGNASSIDSYSYSVIKTGAATFTVLAALTKFV